ncbi:MAG TPA: SurA N-terminal domain-containing protein, partial [Candidatus Sulfotelmatobacter sp.]|nr:SurA N-terminal domain-containing protein [Candidatus Sulfotelmatobacter sp.]
MTTNPVAGLAAATPAGTTPAAKPANPSDVIIEVDGTKLTTGRFDSDLKKQMAAARDQIPANQVDQARASIKKRIVQEFIVRTLLADEIKRKNITTSEKEVAEALESIKKNLPPGMTIDEMMKKNQVTGKEMAQNLAFSINVHKLVVASMGNKKKPTDKEIADFYKKNKDKFKTPDTARARHILIAKAAGDDEKA